MHYKTALHPLPSLQCSNQQVDFLRSCGRKTYMYTGAASIYNFKNKDTLNVDPFHHWETEAQSGNEFCLHELLSSALPPAKKHQTQNVFNCCFAQVWPTTRPFIPSVGGRSTGTCPEFSQLGNRLKPPPLQSNHVRLVLPWSSLFPSVSFLSQSHKCCPEWLFLKWQSPQSLRIQRHLGRDWWGCDPVTSPKTQTELPPPIRDGC